MRAALLLALAAALAACPARPADVATLRDRAAGGSGRAFRQLVSAMADEDAVRAGEARKAVLGLGASAGPFLIEALRSSDAEVFEAGAAALGNLRLRGAVGDLIGALRGTRPRRYAAAWALGEIGDPASIDPLVGALDDTDASVRKEAVRALVKIGNAAEKSLVAYLADRPEGEGQRGAIRVLGEVRARGAIPFLGRVEGKNRDAAVWALGRIGDPSAIVALVAALQDARWPVRREAAEALGSMEDAEAVAHLQRALEDPEPVVREWAARSIEVITGRPTLYRGEDGDMVPPYNLYR